jgi:glutathione peroxidase-family protein
MTTLHDFQVRSIEGDEHDLGQYAGKVVLVVNTASACGFTPQLAGLQQLYERFGPQGLVVLGFPATSSATRTRPTTATSPPSARRTTAWSFR